MDEELRSSLQRFIEGRAEAANVAAPPETVNPLIAKIDEQITRQLNQSLFAADRIATAETSCTTFDCPQKFGCDWF